METSFSHAIDSVPAKCSPNTVTPGFPDNIYKHREAFRNLPAKQYKMFQKMMEN